MAKLLKDQFFSKQSIGQMGEILHRYCSDFDQKRFIKIVDNKAFRGMELKARMRHTTEGMQQCLPSSYRRALAVLVKAAPEITGFQAMCLPDFVECYGLQHWDLSLKALALFTKYSSSEFAIRPFIKLDSKRAMDFMQRLSHDPDANVRRFASEGCRPRLPWAMALPAFKKDPAPVLAVLQNLRDDDSEFVRRSVANNLNDISKDHPIRVLDICHQWQGQSPGTDWIIKHACRTLLKAGHPRAMSLFGFANPKKIAVEKLKLAHRRISLGATQQFDFILDVATKKACQVRLEYVVDYVKAKGKTSRKVFQICEKSFDPGQHHMTKKQAFADLSTRKHYPGKHRITVVVNGVEKDSAQFVLGD